MAKTVTPSVEASKTTTEGQITKAVANYRALLEKHAREFDSEVVQTVLGQSELASEMFELFRRRIEVISNLIVRRVSVNRTRKPQAVLDATGRAQYTDRKVVDAMPKGEGDEVEVVFFKPDLSERNGFISDDDLEKEFELRGLKPADPYSVAAVNEADPAFADEKPNGTHWKDAKGNWCGAVFNRWCDERRVGGDRDGRGWRDYWWFAGVRK
jgi:hypothetical protein